MFSQRSKPKIMRGEKPPAAGRMRTEQEQASTAEMPGPEPVGSPSAMPHPTSELATDRREPGTDSESSIPNIHVREVRQGRRPGERYVRIHRPFHDTFREAGPDVLVAREHTYIPRSRLGRFWYHVRRILIGPALPTAHLIHERLSKTKALAVFSSDALSSSAYATEEIVRALVLAGAAALAFTMPVAMGIALLLAIVATSYRQTIKAYPQGGGAYIVTKDNLGTWPALVAAASLLIDYILTVAVSISAGILALTSAAPYLLDYKVLLALGCIAFITTINLRGVRESGTIFSVPTYLFIVTAFAMIGLGIFRLATGSLDFNEAHYAEAVASWAASEEAEALTIFLILRAFASGCAALTGTEAISDGVPAFKPPEWQNARTTLTWMAILLAGLFLGISYLAVQLGTVPSVGETESVVSMIARQVFDGGPVYYLMQAATVLILVLAANTAYSDFPRLSWFLARDHFMPHQFSFRGDRLAFSTGIITLGLFSALLVVWFDASTHALIPLYAVGVFTSFTLSQASMVRRWWTRREPGWRYSLPVNAIGAITTGVVTIVVASTKFTHGAWMVLVLIPLIVVWLWRVNGHYIRVADQLAMEPTAEPMPEYPEPILVVPVPGLNRAVARTLGYAHALSKNVTAVHVTDDLEDAAALRRRWKQWGSEVPLVILESKYRSLTGPLLHYLDVLSQKDPTVPVTVVLAEYVQRRWWEWPLHNQTAARLKWALFFRPNTTVLDVPYHLVR